MAHATRTAPRQAALPAPFDFAAMFGFADAFFGVQRAQWEALVAWQQSVAAAQQELWDEWVSRWAGGVPLDA